MSLRIDPETLLATAHALRCQVRWLAGAPLPPGHDPAVVRARELAADVTAEVVELADRLVDLVHELSRQEDAVAADYERLRRRWQA